MDPNAALAHHVTIMTRSFYLDRDTPMVITKVGDYLTRDGTRVSVTRIGGCATFNVYGYVWREYRGRYVPKDYRTWSHEGTFKAIGTHSLDIVERTASFKDVGVGA